MGEIKERPAGEPRQLGRRAEKKARHRLQILEATLQSIAEHGLAGTTVSTVVTLAGLSRGMVNLHFTSKQALFREALALLSQRYRDLWETALEQSGPSPQDKLQALLEADMGPEVLRPEMLGVWVAFRAVAAQQEQLLPLYDTRDRDNMEQTSKHCLLLLQQNNAEGDLVARAEDTAAGLAAMVEGFWVECHLHPKAFDHARALKICRDYLMISLSDKAT